MTSLQTAHAWHPRSPTKRTRLCRYRNMLAAIMMGGILISCGKIGSAVSAELHDVAYVRHIVLTVHKSRTLQIEKPFAKALVAAPEIADVLPMSNQTIYIQAKKIG